MFPYLDIVTSSDLSIKDKLTYYATINLFHGANIDEKQIRGLKEKILNLIGSPLSRCDGLLLLEAVLQQRTPFYFDRWQDVVIANLKASNTVCQEIALRVLKLILKSSKSGEYRFNIELLLPAVIELLLSTSNSNCLASLENLWLCIKYYPNTIPKLAVESFLVKQMDTNSTKVSEAAANCFCALPRCSDSKDSTKIVLSKAYATTFKKLLYSLQDIFNQLLGINEVYPIDDDDDFETFPLSDMPDTDFSKILTFSRIFSSFSVCVAKFLCQENAVFEVPVLWILQFIDRVFYLTDFLKNCTIADSKQLLELAYPIILKGAFTILESLIQNFGLIHQTENIISLLKKAIEASYISTFVDTPNCQIRSMTWRILNILLKKHGSQISMETGISNFLLRELHNDIKPENSAEASPVNMKRQHQMPPKNRKMQDVSPERDCNSHFNSIKTSTCNEALKALQQFVNTASTFQDESLKENITNCIFATCREIQTSKQFPFPYQNEKIRKNLYKIVIAVSTSNCNIRILQQASAVLRVAHKDKSGKIKLLNRRANSISRHLLQPRKKFPEAVTNSKPVQESHVEENVFNGWENAVPWSMNHSGQETHNTDHQILNVHHEITENNASLSSEAHHISVDNEIQNNFPSSNFDRTRNANHSDSENDVILDQDVSEHYTSESFVNADHQNDVVRSENHPEMEASSDEDNSSMAEEELDESRVEDEELDDSRVEDEDLEESRLDDEEMEEEDEEEEEGEEDLNINNAAVRPNQNGLVSNSEDDETAANTTKSENGEYSSENGSCIEEETSKEDNTLKGVSEILEEDKKIAKKHKLDNDDNESLVETEEDLPKRMKVNNDESLERQDEEIRVNEVLQSNEDSMEVEETEKTEISGVVQKVVVHVEVNCSSEEVIQTSCHQEEEVSTTSKSPTFDEMCADLVLSESANLADS